MHKRGGREDSGGKRKHALTLPPTIPAAYPVSEPGTTLNGRPVRSDILAEIDSMSVQVRP